ncbi:MAG: hypothetical protein HY078_07680 [Elusimicrobia bacterium]|nr:hypothetical protein [Elusimicrobiota bacterium]
MNLKEKIDAFKLKLAAFDKKKLGMIFGGVALVAVLAVIGLKFARRTPAPAPPPPPAPRPAPPPPAPKPAPGEGPGAPSVAKSTGAAMAPAAPTRKPAPLVDRDLEQEARRKKLDDAITACANEIGLFCNYQRNNDWLAVKCLREHASRLLPACRAKVDAMRSAAAP